MVEPVFVRPTSVFVSGNSRPLLNWVAFALASSSDPTFVWTDVRLRGETVDPKDPLASNVIPEDRLSLVNADQLTRNDAVANMAFAGVIRSDEPPENVRRLTDFLRLPSHTQELLAATRRRGRPPVLVLSNAHRMVALYPTDTVAPVVHAIVDSGAILLVTWADAPPEGRLAFTHILHVDGGAPSSWRQATLKVEKGGARGLPGEGSASPLGQVGPVAEILTRHLG